MLKDMTIWFQLPVIAVFIGLLVYLGRSWPRRVILTINALAGGIILFLIIKTVSNVINGVSATLGSEQSVSMPLNPVIYTGVSLFGLVGIPLILVFAVGERRRSVVLAVAFGLFNLVFALVIGSETATGLYSAGLLATGAMLILFLLEGVSIGALLMRGQPEPLYILGLGLTAVLPAIAGFNLGASASLDLVEPFILAAAAGFFIFYLPFILKVGKDQNDVRWQFIGMLAGLILAGLVVTTLPI
jgi:hypothetical protein